MAGSMDRPHDKFFRAMFSHRDITLDYLRNFLPPDVLTTLDLDSLERLETSYTTGKLRQYFADVVYRCGLKEHDAEVKVTILWEHKSQVDTYPHLQLLRYLLQVWEDNLKQNEPLSYVLPIVFYHGEKQWHKQNMEDYLPAILPELLPFVPRFEYVLTDLATLSDEQISGLQAGILINALILLKHARDKGYLRAHPHLIFQIDEQKPAAKTFLGSLVVYFAINAEIKTEEEFKTMVEESQGQYERFMEIIEGVFARYERDGLEQGLQQGRHIATVNFVHHLADQGKSAATISELLGIPLDEVEAILHQNDSIEEEE